MQQTSPHAYLIIRLGSRWTDVLRLQQPETAVIGRSSENQIVVREEQVSRRHATISPSKDGWQLTDLGSRNGTVVNGQAIVAPQLLKDGDVIGVGSGRIVFSTQLSLGFGDRDGAAAEALGSGKSTGSQPTQVIPEPTIVQRLANSHWSAESIVWPRPLTASKDQPGTSLDRQAEADRGWGFFYRLVAELVLADSGESAAQVALDRVGEYLSVSSGGVVRLGAEPVDASQVAKTTASATPQLAMSVMATRQPPGTAYHRLSDFLVSTILSERQAVLARNVQDDTQLALARQSAQRETVSIICAPLFDDIRRRDAVVGLLHIYTRSGERTLTDADLELVVGAADNLSLTLAARQQNADLAQRLESTRRHVDELQQQLWQSSEMVGHSQALAVVQKAIDRAAPTSATVLIRGESGVGKELVARAIHRSSRRADGPLVCLNCAALAPTLLESELFGHERGAFTGATERKIGKFEAADGGTLLLDEIGEMNAELQAKFLRALEGQPFERLGGQKPIRTDVRVIAATNRDLEEAVQAKEFRSDLYFRLRVIEITVPPLRQRSEDIPPLVEYFLQQLGHHANRRLQGVAPEALELLCRHSWPGNIRELRNVIERAIVLGNGSIITVEDLSLSALSSNEPSTRDAAASSIRCVESVAAETEFKPVALAELEKQHIFRMLKHTDGNKSKASQLLGIERSTLDRKLKRFQEAE